MFWKDTFSEVHPTQLYNETLHNSKTSQWKTKV